MLQWIILLFVSVATARMNYFVDENSIVVDIPKPHARKYKPNWNDLDSRPLPEWYDKAKIGIFLHWGVYSVPSFHSEWFWNMWQNNADIKAFMEKNYPPGFTYQEFAPMFKAEFFLPDQLADLFSKAGAKGLVISDNADIKAFMEKNYPPGFTYQEFAPMFKAEFFLPDQLADLFSKAGAKYVVLTSKHHEGYTLFPSKKSYSWNSVDVGPHRDLVGELAKSVRAKGLKFGVYHSLYEWYNPIYLQDAKNNFQTRDYVETKLLPDIKQIINDYKPSVFWSDGDWEATEQYWNSTGLLSWLYSDSPVADEIVVNDRWGKNTACKHGDFYNCQDRYNPGHLMNHKWENAFTVDKQSWGYRRNMNLEDVMTMDQLIKEVVSTVSCGGNVLINVGPTKEGTIAPVFQERLKGLGRWLKVNGEAIYSSSPWVQQNDTAAGDVWYTCTKTNYDAIQPVRKPNASDKIVNIYAIFLKWPRNNILRLRFITSYLHSGNYKVMMLGNNGYLQWEITNGESLIHLPDKATLSTEHAWTLKFIGN